MLIALGGHITELMWTLNTHALQHHPLQTACTCLCVCVCVQTLRMCIHDLIRYGKETVLTYGTCNAASGSGWATVSSCRRGKPSVASASRVIEGKGLEYTCKNTKNNPVKLRQHPSILFLCDTFTTHEGSHASDLTSEVIACWKGCSGCRVGGKVSCNAHSHEAVISPALCEIYPSEIMCFPSAWMVR